MISVAALSEDERGRVNHHCADSHFDSLHKSPVKIPFAFRIQHSQVET